MKPSDASSRRKWLASQLTRVVAERGRAEDPLTAVDKRYAEWAKAVGVEYGPLAARKKRDMICELDAVAAHLYGLEERHLVHIFETFHEAWRPGTSCNHPRWVITMRGWLPR